MSGSAVPADVIAEAVAAARAYLRMADDSETGVLAGLAGSAIALAEAFCGTALVMRGFEDVLTAERGWQRLAAGPVSAIDGVMALPAAGAPVVLPVGAYAVDIDGDGVGWVRVGPPGKAAVSYRAGLATDWAGVPAPLAQGVAMLIAHLFGDRDGERVPPAAVAALWRPFRRLRLQVEHHA